MHEQQLTPSLFHQSPIEQNEFNRAAAEAFLHFLDPTTNRFSFQTFDDLKRKRPDGKPEHPELLQLIHGSLSENWPLLCDLSRRGAGIYVTVNCTNFRRRTAKNIVRIRSLFGDGDEVPVTNLSRLNLIPHWLQQTSAGDINSARWHGFYKVAGVPLDEFKPLQHRLASLFGSDPSVCDPSRVMRLTGFPNRKEGQCYIVHRLSDVTPPKDGYSLDEFRAALEEAERRSGAPPARPDGPQPPGALSPRPNGHGAPSPRPNSHDKSLAQKLAVTSPPTPWSEGEEARLRSALTMISSDARSTWLKYGFALHDLAKADPRWTGPGRTLFDQWSRTSFKFNEKDQDKTWASFNTRDYTGPRTTVATIYYDAKERGWVDPGITIPAEARDGAAGEAPEHTKDRPVIRIHGGGLAEETDAAELALLNSGRPIYIRADALVHPVSEDIRAADVTALDGQRIKRFTKTARFRQFNIASLRDWMCRSIDFQHFDARSRKWLHINPPGVHAATVLSRKGTGKFPQVIGIITTPTLRPDYSVLDAPGYDAETQLYHVVNPELRMPDMRRVPSRADAEAALDLIDALLDGFPYVSDVDRAVALSGIMTAVLRGALPVAPLHGFSAPAAGSGKSFQVDVAAAVAIGRLCPVIAAGKTEEETEKRLGALLRDGVPVVSIDNISGELGGDMLCQLTERGKVHVRILGKSEAPEFDCRSMVFATGNDLVVVGDMVRRTIRCQLDAKVERPELRNFKFDPFERVLQNRGAYVAACLTIPRAYHAAGATARCNPLASYEEWGEMVRKPLIWLGEADPVDSMEKLREDDSDLAADRELFALWREHFNGPPEGFKKMQGEVSHLSGPITSSQIIEYADDRYSSDSMSGPKFKHPELHDLLMRKANVGNQISSKRLGKWLSKLAGGKIVNGQRLYMTVSTATATAFISNRPRPARKHERQRQGDLGDF
jgi:putative DNA primase/helicase